MPDLLLELGSEELPAGFIDDGASQLRERVLKALDEARLGHGTAVAYGTPRRLAVLVSGVVDGQATLDKQVLGPPSKAAFDAAGKPTQAALGFARVNGLEVDKLERVSTPKGEYLAAQVREIGKPTGELLPSLLRDAIAGLSFPKTMRWGNFEETYPRPLLWILALHGEHAVQLSYAGIHSGRDTRGHRFLQPDPFPLRQPADYAAALRERGVEVEGAARLNAIVQQLRAVAAQVGCTPSAESERALLPQVKNLVEWPTAVLGHFEAAYLDLPREVLLSEMTVHQRYFALDAGGSAAGKLSHHFIAVAGTAVRDPAVAAHGFERVLRARLSDARFFYDEDRKQTLAARVASLGTVVFQQKLGTVLEKAERVAQLAAFLADELKLPTDCRSFIARAARLAKADLVSGMVGEFPELQGIMGGYYAEADQEPKAVAVAIRDQYLPRFAGDGLPGSVEAAVIGLADRIDTLAGLFGIGKPPTGSADPFALRRACLAVILVTCHQDLRFSLTRVLERALQLLDPKLSVVEPPKAAADGKPKAEPKAPPAPAAILQKLRDFFRARLKALWSEEFAPDVVEAILAPGFDDLWAARKRLESLGAFFAKDGSGGDCLGLAQAFKRAASILERVPADRLKGEVDPELLSEEPERALWKSQLDVRRRVDARLAGADYQGALEEMTKLKPAIDLFFDKVMVMAEDIPTRENRFRLLAAVRTLFGQVADLSQLQGA